MKILIVDDNARMRRLMRRLVADLADEIGECGDGALAVYPRQGTDCVLIDIDGPQLDGLETSRQIISAFPEAHILMLSDDDDARWRAAATAAGGSGYVLKDNLLDLRQRLKSLLQSKPETNQLSEKG